MYKFQTNDNVFNFFSDLIKPRHKTHLIYQFTESQKANNLVAVATLNLYIYSKISLKSLDLKTVDIEIATVLKSSSHKRTFNTFRNITIPENQESRYFQFNITELVSEWFSSRDESHAIVLKVTDSSTGDSLPHKIISLDIENFETVSCYQIPDKTGIIVFDEGLKSVLVFLQFKKLLHCKYQTIYYFFNDAMRCVFNI
jgi:hypothetical protein